MPYFDEEGNEVKDVLPPDEIQKIKVEMENSKKELENNKKELEQARGKLAGFENKEFNFKKVRDMAEEEKKNLTTQQIEFLKRQEKLEDEHANFKKQIIESYKSEVLNKYSKEDEELKKKIEYHYNRFSGDAVTKEEISQRMEDAYELANKGLKRLDKSVSKAFNYSGETPKIKKVDNTLTEEQLDLAKKLGLGEKTLKKYFKL